MSGGRGGLPIAGVRVPTLPGDLTDAHRLGSL